MPKVSVYLPDELYRAARERGVSVSTVAQNALRDELAAAQNEQWIEWARGRLEREAPAQISVSDLIADVRDEFGR